MSIEQKLCKVKIFQLQSMPNVTTCIDKRFAAKNSGKICLAFNILYIQLEHSENDNPAGKKSVQGC